MPPQRLALFRKERGYDTVLLSFVPQDYSELCISCCNRYNLKSQFATSNAESI